MRIPITFLMIMAAAFMPKDLEPIRVLLLNMGMYLMLWEINTLKNKINDNANDATEGRINEDID
jgi:hypothetical protein